MVKCTKCYAINKPEAKFCGSCGQTLVPSGQKTGQTSPSRPVYSPPVRNTSIKPSYNLPVRVGPPSMPAMTQSAPSMPAVTRTAPVEQSKQWSSDGELEDNFALSTIEDENSFSSDLAEDKKDSYSLDLVSEDETDAYHLTEDFKKQEPSPDIRDERKFVPAETKSSDMNIVNSLFSGDRNLMELFIIQEIMTPPKFKRSR